MRTSSSKRPRSLGPWKRGSWARDVSLCDQAKVSKGGARGGTRPSGRTDLGTPKLI